MRTLFTLLITTLLLVSCGSEDELLHYDTAETSVYFAYRAGDNSITGKNLDSLTYNFSLDEDLTITENVLKIPVRISGLATATDREIKYSIESLDGVFDNKNLEFTRTTIGANQYIDTVFIRVKRDPKLAEKDQVFNLNILANEHFSIGEIQNSKIKIIIADRLRMPNWWNKWSNYMGKYYKEVYQKWISMYTLGVDPTPDIYGVYPGPYYSWENMPPGAVYNWCPVTFQYIQKLKQYFEENEIYPDGDTSLRPIKLP
ncbi:DUF4843 domain-containing protein [Sphingobacterium humi]|uniref:DUF4843 domain-containing protein n=1 Tax=Sphingobacterium humi TaxID=1796905 RepID=A0A6N8KUT9_9SPHI|nr:DUF4843 domain-containing protein [Sphingobacterium humi]MVZ60554.1 DUF4843 domain-containing protein [Sphingobacterium humi]